MFLLSFANPFILNKEQFMHRLISNIVMKHILCVFVCLTNTFLCVGQTKHALLIGISDYCSEKDSSENRWDNIHGTNDVRLLFPTLEQQGFEIKELCNSKANAANIRKAISTLEKKTQKGDIVYIHFSCHGQPIEDLDKDEIDGWDEALIPVDAKKIYQEHVYTGENHIIDDELNLYLEALRGKVGKTGFVYVIIDACHAGSSYRGEEKEEEIVFRGTNMGFSASQKPFVPKIDRRGRFKVDASASMADVCVLEACRSYQLNSEIRENGEYYGSLSYYVNLVLRTNKLGKDINWVYQVSEHMKKDIRLVRQNLVIETTL